MLARLNGDDSECIGEEPASYCVASQLISNFPQMILDQRLVANLAFHCRKAREPLALGSGIRAGLTLRPSCSDAQ